MTTPPDAALHAALDRADAALLARLSATRACPSDLLGRMVRHPAPRIRHLGLTLLAERLDEPGSGPGNAPGPRRGEPGPGGGATEDRESGQVDRLTHLLPDSPGSSPEESLLLARLHARIAVRRPAHRLPDWRAGRLPVRVRIAWLRAELLGDPAVLRTEPVGELLYRAVRECRAADAHRPDRLVAELVDTGDPVLRIEALRLARDGLQAGLLAPAFVRGRLLHLVDTPDHDVVTGALHALAEPWAAVTPVAQAALTRVVERAEEDGGRDGSGYEGPGGNGKRRSGDPAASVAAALVVAARHGHPAVLWSMAENPAAAPAPRRRAVELLGERAERTDIGRLVELAATDPLLLAGPALACLRALHRRGHFPAERDAGPLLALALADHTLPAQDVATVLYTCRHRMLDVLTDAPATAPDWPRRLALLVALARQGAADVPIGEAVTRLLPAARAPRPFLGALRALRPPNAEEAVLALLPTAPAAALDALEAIGGEPTRTVLAHALGVGSPEDVPADALMDSSRTAGPADVLTYASHTAGPADVLTHAPGTAGPADVLTYASATGVAPPPAPGGARGIPPLPDPGRARGLPEPLAPARAPRLPVAPALRPVRDRALALLWHLTEDPARRRALLARLDPQNLPPDVEADLGAPDEGELAVLRARVDGDDPVASLCRVARYAGPRTLPLVADLLLRVVRDLAAPGDPDVARPADASRPGAGQGGDARPDGEPELPAEALEAVCSLGRRLRERRRVRPVCLLDAPAGTGAGHAFLADTVLGLLERPGLTGGEQAVLLKALLQVPASPSTRARVHRMLRHRDPHVRKHVIALLAHDASGDDARALSATLVPLTRDPDIRTVRAALAALGTARARWAGEAVAACLHHRNMNIRKTAAAALLHAGAPASVPHLLRAIGRDDNPGLRSAMAGALRAVVGDAYAATLLAAAEAAGDVRVRRLLLSALDREVTVRAVLALDAAGSPAVPVLLTLIAEGAVRPASGSVEELAEALTRHGVRWTRPEPPTTPGGPPDGAEADLVALVRTGWDPATALRIARRSALPDAGSARRHPSVRGLFGRWLELADHCDEAGDRSRVVCCAVRLCPGPWSPEEQETLARYAGTLADAFDAAVTGGAVTGVPGASGAPEAAGHSIPRQRAERAAELLDVLYAIAPHLSSVRRFAAVEGLRLLASADPGGLLRPEALAAVPALLRRLGAVLVRADLDRALAAAHLGADPWRTAPAVLREVFGVPVEQREGVDEPACPSDELTEGVRSPEAPARLRDRCAASRGGAGDEALPESRKLLAALVDAYPGAASDERGSLVDRMSALQPLDAPEWTISETRETLSAEHSSRTVRAEDLDQPRSAVQRDRLLALLEAERPERRTAAAQTLRHWPEPQTALAVLRAYLRGRTDVLPDPAVDLPAPLAAYSGEGCGSRHADAESTAHDASPERVLAWLARLPGDELTGLAPTVVTWWEHGPPAVHEAARVVLHAVPADALAHLLAPRIEAGDLGLLDLLSGSPLLRTPALDRAARRLRAQGREDMADRLVLVDGPLRAPGSAYEDEAVLDAVRTSPRAPAAPAEQTSLSVLIRIARDGAPERIRRALTRIVELGTSASGGGVDPELICLMEELLRHPRTGVRLHAHRVSRTLFDRDTHARLTVFLLADPVPDVVRGAIRMLGRAAWEPALPDLVRLLGHPKPAVRTAARDALVDFGATAVPPLRRAAARARPDRRSLYTDVLAGIDARAETEAATTTEAGTDTKTGAGTDTRDRHRHPCRRGLTGRR
ncbi:HEAT repeat domain-containing protein [Streptomyces sp. WL006]|uniref:HEAT repeat domain-containing protein n=1 Tax=Streptomyces sp. WL006 TaxID=3423915 RepID=UPI003F6D2876